jgi:hypothetical protein
VKADKAAEQLCPSFIKRACFTHNPATFLSLFSSMSYTGAFYISWKGSL